MDLNHHSVLSTTAFIFSVFNEHDKLMLYSIMSITVHHVHTLCMGRHISALFFHQYQTSLDSGITDCVNCHCNVLIIIIIIIILINIMHHGHSTVQHYWT